MSRPTPLHHRALALARRHVLASASLVTLLWGLGRVLGDGDLVSSLLFYLPSVGIALAWLSVALLDRRRALRRVAPLLAAAFLTQAVLSDWTPHRRISDATKVDGELLLVQWNLFRNFLPWSSKISRLRSLEADVYLLNELPRQVTRGNWALKLGPGFNYVFGDLLAVACRGEILEHAFAARDGLQTLKAVCRIDGRDLKIWTVDISASPFMLRRPILDRLRAQIEAEQPDLVGGDFNTPRRSSGLRTLPAGYEHAYLLAGSGWPYNWPCPLPMLDLDQLLVGSRVDALEHRQDATPVSDHRLQTLRFWPRPEPSDLGAPNLDRDAESGQGDGAVYQPQEELEGLR